MDSETRYNLWTRVRREWQNMSCDDPSTCTCTTRNNRFITLLGHLFKCAGYKTVIVWGLVHYSIYNHFRSLIYDPRVINYTMYSSPSYNYMYINKSTWTVFSPNRRHVLPRLLLLLAGVLLSQWIWCALVVSAPVLTLSSQPRSLHYLEPVTCLGAIHRKERDTSMVIVGQYTTRLTSLRSSSLLDFSFSVRMWFSSVSDNTSFLNTCSIVMTCTGNKTNYYPIIVYYMYRMNAESKYTHGPFLKHFQDQTIN